MKIKHALLLVPLLASFYFNANAQSGVFPQLETETYGGIKIRSINSISDFQNISDFASNVRVYSWAYLPGVFGPKTPLDLTVIFAGPYLEASLSDWQLCADRLTVSAGVNTLIAYDGNSRDIDDDGAKSDDFFFGTKIGAQFKLSWLPLDYLNLYIDYYPSYRFYSKAKETAISIPESHPENAFEGGIGYFIDYPFLFGVVVYDVFTFRGEDFFWGYDGSEEMARFDSCLEAATFVKIRYAMGIPAETRLKISLSLPMHKKRYFGNQLLAYSFIQQELVHGYPDGSIEVDSSALINASQTFDVTESCSISLLFDTLVYTDEDDGNVANGIGGEIKFAFPKSYLEIGASYGLNDVCDVDERIQIGLFYTMLFS